MKYLVLSLVISSFFLFSCENKNVKKAEGLANKINPVWNWTLEESYFI